MPVPSWRKRLRLERNEKCYQQQQQQQREFVTIQRKNPLSDNGKMITARQLMSKEKVQRQNKSQKQEGDLYGTINETRDAAEFSFGGDQRGLIQMPSEKKKTVDGAILEDGLPGSCSRVSSCSLDSILLIDESVQDVHLHSDLPSKGCSPAECDLPSAQTEQTYVSLHRNELPVSPLLDEEGSLLSQKAAIKKEERQESSGKENTDIQWGECHGPERSPSLANDEDLVVKEEFDDGLEDTEIVVLDADKRFLSLPKELPSIHQSHHWTTHATDSSLTNGDDHLLQFHLRSDSYLAAPDQHLTEKDAVSCDMSRLKRPESVFMDFVKVD